MNPPPLPLFAGTGIELEYMIVDAHTLNVRSIADQVLKDETGQPVSTLECGQWDWSNELALHIMELKTKGPVPTLRGLPAMAQQDISEINRRLYPLGACLMPTAAHPWMDPLKETRLWPHEYNEVYEAFNRIFTCQGHGWSNLQSQHINLPFANDDEFARLHAAIRLVLPLLPALAASSPYLEGHANGCRDRRLQVYRTNCAKIPSITGQVIPEPVYSRQEYENKILQRIYRDVAPLDPEGILQDEWLNARGAIARFERQSIEIRLLDVQETPGADLAIAAAIIAVLQALVVECWSDLPYQQSLSTEALEAIFLDTTEQAEKAVVNDSHYLKAFGLKSKTGCSAGEIWCELLAKVRLASTDFGQDCLNIILNEGCLATRILRATGSDPSRDHLRSVYQELCRCLAQGEVFLP